jgi:hypothetical protein
MCVSFYLAVLLVLKQAHRNALVNNWLAINYRARRHFRESLASDILARLFLLQTYLRIRITQIVTGASYARA